MPGATQNNQLVLTKQTCKLFCKKACAA